MLPAASLLASVMPWYCSTKSAQTTYSSFLCKGKLPYISLLQNQPGFTGLILRFGKESVTIALQDVSNKKGTVCMTQEKIARINELARKSRTEEGLTAAEKEEQAALRREYIDSMKNSLRMQLENTDVIDEDGNRGSLASLYKKK